jgi:bifunctional non-homologous end joining protein LigD
VSAATDAARHVEVDGRLVRLTHLDRVLWPSTGFTKRAMLEYYVRVAPVLLPHLRGRPLTMWRYPEGVEAKGWWQNESRRAPDWMPVYEYDAADGRHHRHCVVDDVASLLWVGNQGTVELHPFLFRATDPSLAPVVVFDLDPGEPATLADACAVGSHVRKLWRRRGCERSRRARAPRVCTSSCR